MSNRISFEKLRNTRDLGGMKTADGKAVKSARLMRSGHLADMSENDVAQMAPLVDTIVDFRTPRERSEQPDKEIPQSVNIHIPIVNDMTSGISREEESDHKLFAKLLLKPREAKAYMCDMYRAFSGDFAVSQYSKFLQILQEAEGGVLWHCTAGKDRAGIASVIVEKIVGVPDEDITADYLKTNEYIAEDVAALTKFVQRQSAAESELAEESLRYLFGAEPEYLQAYYDAIDEKFGSFDTFVKDGLGIGEQEKERLQRKYLEW